MGRALGRDWACLALLAVSVRMSSNIKELKLVMESQHQHMEHKATIPIPTQLSHMRKKKLMNLGHMRLPNMTPKQSLQTMQQKLQSMRQKLPNMKLRPPNMKPPSMKSRNMKNLNMRNQNMRPLQQKPQSMKSLNMRLRKKSKNMRNLKWMPRMRLPNGVNKKLVYPGNEKFVW